MSRGQRSKALLSVSYLFGTYGKNLKDVDAREVQFLILGVHRKRYRYVAEVL